MTVGGTLPKYERHKHKQILPFFRQLWSGTCMASPQTTLKSLSQLLECLCRPGLLHALSCQPFLAILVTHSSVPGGGSPWHGPSQPYPSPLFYLGPCSNLPGFGEAFRLLWCVIVMKHYLELELIIFFFSIWRGLSNQQTDIIGDWTLVIEKVFTNLIFPGTNIWKVVDRGQTHTTLQPGHDLKGKDIFDQWLVNKSLFCKNAFSFPTTITLPCSSMKSDNKWWVWMHFKMAKLDVSRSL